MGKDLVGEMNPCIVEESRMDPGRDAAIRRGLCVCFPADREVFARTRAWHGVAPAWSVLIEEANGTVLAHVGLVERTILAGGEPLRVAGVQNVFVLPERRGQGLLRRLMQAAMAEADRRGLDCGLLFCTPEIGAIYARQGWQPLDERPIVRVDERGAEVPLPPKNIALIYPLRRDDFPAGEIHLQGNDW